MLRTASVSGAIFLSVVAWGIPGASSAWAGEQTLTAQHVIDLSLRNNGELKALREEKGVREAARMKAGLYPNPVFEADWTTGEITGSPSEQSISIGISQELLTMGKREKRLHVSEKEIEAFDRQVENFGRLLEQEAKTTFYEVLLAERKVELAERSLALNQQLLDVTRQRLEAGDIPELEVNLVQVEVARSEGRKIEAQRELYPRMAKLQALVGLSPGEGIRLNGALEGTPVAKTLEELTALAKTKRSDLRALEAEKSKLEAETALAKAERVPNFIAGMGYQREETAIEVSGAEGRSRDNLISFKLSVPIPLFDTNQAGIREAQAKKSSAESRYAFARMTVEREVEGAYASMIAAEKALALYSRGIIPQLEENLKLVQEAYRLGEVGILAVIEEQKKFFEVHEGHLEALFNRRSSLIKLESAVGQSLE